MPSSRMRRRRSFLLIELLIALVLFAMMMGMLFNSLWCSIRLSHTLEKAKKEVLERGYLHARLTEVLSRLTPHTKKDSSSFHTGKPPHQKELFFRFKNGIDPNPDLCNEVSGRLSMRHTTLYLTTTGKQKREKEEILMRDIRRISFDFYPENQQKTEKICSLWEEERQDLPLFFVLHINRGEKEDLLFPFAIADKKEGITLLRP